MTSHTLVAHNTRRAATALVLGYLPIVIAFANWSLFPQGTLPALDQPFARMALFVLLILNCFGCQMLAKSESKKHDAIAITLFIAPALLYVASLPVLIRFQ